MPSGFGKKPVQCSKCGAERMVNNATKVKGYRCPDCPRVCARCGSEFVMSATAIFREYRCPQCNALRQRRKERTIEGQFATSKGIALRRGLPWSLTFAEYTSLRSLPCHYCCCELPPTGLGLDRLNDSLGYISSNVVPCCWECNCAKGQSFSPEEMYIVGAAIREVKRLRKERSETYERRNGWGRPRKYQLGAEG